MSSFLVTRCSDLFHLESFIVRVHLKSQRSPENLKNEIKGIYETTPRKEENNLLTFEKY